MQNMSDPVVGDRKGAGVCATRFEEPGVFADDDGCDLINRDALNQ